MLLKLSTEPENTTIGEAAARQAALKKKGKLRMMWFSSSSSAFFQDAFGQSPNRNV